MLRFCDNPEIVLPRTDDLSTLPASWWIGHTRARCEKAFAVDLTALGIPYFLPMVERLTFSGGRKRRGMLPLFSSYVFFAGGEVERDQAMLTDRLCRVIEVNDQPRLIEGLSIILRALRDRLPVEKLIAQVGEMEQFASMEIAPQLLESTTEAFEPAGRVS
jgi:hypothetical protein